MIIAQLSDPHITADGDTSDLERAVGHLLRMPARPDVVLVTGDCVEHGLAEEYARFQPLIQRLPMPVYVIPGNHDSREQLLGHFGQQGAQALPGYAQYVVDAGPLRLIALDSNIPGSGAGLLDAERLEWLAQRLAEAPERPTLLFMHHPPFLTGLAPFDQIGLTGAEELGAIVARYSNVQAILAGHVHATMLRRFYGAVAMTCPSTKHQLLPDFHQPERLTVTMEPPACLIHIWREQTGLLTYTSLIRDIAPVITLHDGERWLV